MPIYQYRDNNTDKMVEVIRKFSDYEITPTKEEAAILSEEEFKVANWERIMGGGIKIIRGPNFSGSKGNWLILLAFLTGIILGTDMAKGAEYLELDHLSMEGYQINNYREPFSPEYNTVGGRPSEDNTEYWKFGSAVNFNLNIVRVNQTRLFWDNRVAMVSTNQQVRNVYWEWKAGFTLIPDKVDLYHYHKSEHVLDAVNPDQRYPLLDMLVLKVTLYNR